MLLCVLSGLTARRYHNNALLDPGAFAVLGECGKWESTVKICRCERCDRGEPTRGREKKGRKIQDGPGGVSGGVR